MLAQRTNGKRSATGGARSLVRVSRSTDMRSHAGSTAEVAYIKFDEDMVFTVRLDAPDDERGSAAYRKE